MTAPVLAAWGRWLDETAVRVLDHAGIHVVDVPPRVTPAQVSPRCNALYVRAPQVADRSVIEMLPDLKVIAVPGAGTEVVDLEAATERGVPVVHGGGYGAASVVEWVLGAIVWLVRDVRRLHRAVRDGSWELRHEVEQRRDVGALRVGVIGFGEIGSRVAAAVQSALGSEIVVADADAARRDAAAVGGFAVVPLGLLLRTSDVVTVHANATLRSPVLLGSEEIASMAHGSFLVNSARGQLVDLAAVADALHDGRLAGAAIDVFADEPPPAALAARLDAHPRVLLSPHASGMTLDAVRALAAGVATDIVGVLSGRPPTQCANPAVRRMSARAHRDQQEAEPT